MPTNRRSTLYWWLRVAVAAFVLSAWMTVAVTSGVAHADGPPSSDGGTSAESAPGEQADPSGTAGAEKPKAANPLRDLRDRLTRHLAPENRIRPAHGDEKKSNARDTKPRGDNEIGSTTVVDDSSPVDENTDVSEAQESPPTPAAKPRLWEVPRALHNERRAELTAVAANPVKPFKPRLVAPPRPVAEREAQPSAQLTAAQPSTANIAPAAPSTPAGVGAVDVPQLARQGVGLASDVGVVAASVVYTIADTVAQAFGSDSFLGVPYALATALANTAAAAGRTLVGGGPAYAGGQGDLTVAYGVLNGLSFFNPQKPPPGANLPIEESNVTAEHPLPIILLNGTTATQGTNWSVGAPVLANAGYNVYTFNYGNVTGDPNSPIQATGDIAKSADELDAEIDRVREETGADKVILIGHSQGGGILPAYYINSDPERAAKVSQVIGIAPSNHGTDFNGLVGLFNVPVLGPLTVAFVNAIGPAFIQQTVGSDFQDVVYGQQDTNPNVRYTNIITRNDEIVTPYTQQALEGDNVTNIVLQDRYPGYFAGHLGVVLSPQVWDIVLAELEANSEANPLLHPDDSEELVA